jgi:peptidyl-prolyl cis-trans isomerase C
MRSAVRFACLAILFASAPLGCKACNEHALDSGGEGGAAPATSLLTAEEANKVLAEVGDHKITLGNYVAALEHMDQFDRLRYQSVERRRELLQEMINVLLLADEAVAKGYDKDPVAQEELRSVLRDAMLKEARKGAPTPEEIPDAEVRAYYDEHKAAYKDPERRRAECVVLGDEASAKSALEAAKKATSATQWGDIVRTKSIDSHAKANVPVDLAGDFGMVSPPGDPRGDNPRIPPEVRAALFEIKNVGDVLDRYVRAADGKYYLVRLGQKTDAHERTPAEADRTIRVKLAQDKLRAQEDALMEELKKEFPVQIDEAALALVRVGPVLDGGAGVRLDAGAD